MVTHVDQASPAAASGIAPGDLIVAAAPPESKMLLVSSAETSFFVALMREANPIFLRLKRGEHESTVCIQKVMYLVPRLPSLQTVLVRTQAFLQARLCASFLFAFVRANPKPTVMMMTSGARGGEGGAQAPCQLKPRHYRKHDNPSLARKGYDSNGP